ncbi:thymidylate synthase (FAD) [Peptoclostridium litorale DSM 5388]|uniref:Flavin-dependent thymidylate synthase n=1 Tax=Peptoclostridium litorale DSM 5388 TaxID=1121324 RepID=A0A069RB80_PEPLI|nr:FAD-dependent thymidylate synthase [Peptoclostridium litorale]KDR94324.1 thymidylate synthase ThyX [Peptoclostridium litorale DSM 5388]SIO29027.1 thymidylate synthase (FAD) [Peptoclostridium litorale DSM 5388]
MKVKLIQYTPQPERVVAMAAKLCYSRGGVDDIDKNLDEAEVERFVQMLVDIGHESPIEHVSFTFAVEGISRACTHQLVRHRLASYSQQSQRYVKLEQFEYIVPEEIEKNPEAKEKFIQAMESDQKVYNELVAILQNSHYEQMTKEGMSEKKAERASEKKAIEDARYVFPNACETKMIFTMNARTLIHFFKKRCCERAQREIRTMADLMLKEVKVVAPAIFKNAGPSCIKSACPEGNMSCGKIEEIRAKYKNL